MLQRNDPFDGQMSLEDVQGLSKQDKAAAPAADQTQAAAPAPKAPPKPAAPKPLADIVPKNGKTLLGDTADQVVINPPDTRLAEEAEHHGVFAYGRFNPPTVGHEKLIHATEKVAASHKVPAHIIASHSEGNAKNPVPTKAKVGYLKKVAAKTSHVSSSDKESPNLLTQAAKLHKQGVTHLHMVAGSDRVGEYHKLLHKYNGTHEGALYNFKHITVHSAGHRDPDAEGTEGMSGTKMRAAAKAGGHEKFRSGLPKALDKHADEIAAHIRNVKEDAEGIDAEMLFEAVVSLQSRMRRSVAAKKNKARLSRTRDIARHRLAKTPQLSRRAMKKAKNILRKRLAGQAGANYATLSRAQKISVDKMVERKKAQIKRIATKLAPRVKSDEIRRLQSVLQGTKFTSSKINVVASFQDDRDIITEKEQRAINEKADASGIDVQTLMAVFKRGRTAWTGDQPPGKTPSQYGFDRLNSFINGGKAFKEDVDLAEQKKTKTLSDVLQQGMHTPRNMGNMETKNLKPVQTAAGHAASIKDISDDSETEQKRKRANIIRRKTQEYVKKVVEERGTRDTASLSLAESVSILIKKVK